MGDEITKVTFNAPDFKRFGERLRAETELASGWLHDGIFSENGFSLGFELEAWLLDHNGYPHPVNEQFLGTLNHPLVVPELSRFNVELNSTPQALSGYVLRSAEMALAELWAQCNAVAHTLDTNMVMIGTLPTIRDQDLVLSNISPLKRYYALNNEVLRQRKGQPLHIDIRGQDHLTIDRSDVMLESATTSFQIHLKIPARLAQAYLNASIEVSGPILAACGNAPFLFGKALWDETRIALFEQAVALMGRHPGVERVTFGRGYMTDAPEQWLYENLNDYPVLLPLCFDEPIEALKHLRLHNGTIWRWNRPLIGFDADSQPHVRLEHRILPSGPTFIDMIANTALYIGLTHHLATADAQRSGLDFSAAKENFYAAARFGLDAKLHWMQSGELHKASEMLLNELLPRAQRGLKDLAIAEDDIARYLGVIEARVASGQTGAVWQRRCLQAANGDWFQLMATYTERQRSGAPVHQWDV